MEYSAGGESRVKHLYGKGEWESRTAQPGTVAHACNPSTWKTDAAGGLPEIKANSGSTVRPCLKIQRKYKKGREKG